MPLRLSLSRLVAHHFAGPFPLRPNKATEGETAGMGGMRAYGGLVSYMGAKDAPSCFLPLRVDQYLSHCSAQLMLSPLGVVIRRRMQAMVVW